ncbi:MAG: glutamate-1-semialdehyde 2,1-aminomutase [Phycisphaerae bacterium]|nr:glutamate-1-semialdehyde 2,1-aminomutase [Phycisphaerae bacterium]
MSKTQNIFEQAKQLIPGGVNSPVRAFSSVGGTPVITEHALGSKLTDIDGKEYIDYIGSWGPAILGHSDPDVVKAITDSACKGISFGTSTTAELTIAKKITELMPTIEMVRMVTSGTEATMSALRLARAYTKRNKLIKFAGSYHGHGDSFLVKAGSGAMTFGTPTSPGVTQATADDTLIAEFNHIDSVAQLIKSNKDNVAAVIVEPVIGNAGVIPPVDNFLQKLRELTTANGVLLIIDEVMTGFRLAPGGAQEIYNVKADLTTMGKVIGGGLPIGAYGGRKEIMQMISPSGPVYQAGTLSGNPIAVAAGLATLNKLNDELYKTLEARSAQLESGIKTNLKKLSLPYTYQRVGSMNCLFFIDKPVISFDDAANCDTEKFSRYYQNMLNNGILLPPSQFEAFFVSVAHSQEDIEKTIKANYDSLC